jgi:hypothetical protein
MQRKPRLFIFLYQRVGKSASLNYMTKNIWKHDNPSKGHDEEIMNVLNSVNTCYHSGHNCLYSRFLSKTVKIKIYISTDYLLIYGCETWTLMTQEEHRARISENMGRADM